MTRSISRIICKPLSRLRRYAGVIMNNPLDAIAHAVVYALARALGDRPEIIIICTRVLRTERNNNDAVDRIEYKAMGVET
jgi:hypothetical protein